MTDRDLGSATNPSSKLNCSETVNAGSERMWKELCTTTAPFKLCFWFASRATIPHHSHGEGEFLFSAFRSSSFSTLFHQYTNSFCANTPCQKVVLVCISPEEKAFNCTLSLIEKRIYTFYFVRWLILCTVAVFLVNSFAKSSAKRPSEGDLALV